MYHTQWVVTEQICFCHVLYMDNTEITNNEYRQFVEWVRDPFAHRLIGGDHLIEEGEYGERINWREN